MFTEFIEINVRSGKVLVVGTLKSRGEETTEWCSLEEIRKAIQAAEQSVRADKCPVCNGSGLEPSSYFTNAPCLPCGGTGKRR
ncbi:MAG: hypothetical protein ABII09_12525 [Planctomycetota bacterium]